MIQINLTDSGLNAIVRVDPGTHEVTTFPLPPGSGYANLNTASFDGRGVLWFTGQSGVYGRLDPATGVVEVFDAPHGRGPYGIATTPDGSIYYASLAGSHIARIDLDSGAATVPKQANSLKRTGKVNGKIAPLAAIKLRTYCGHKKTPQKRGLLSY